MSKLVNNIDANNFKIINHDDPINPLDVVNKQSLDTVSARISYTHEQNIPSSTWLVVHNLGYKPNVRIQNSAGDYIITDYEDIDVNSLYIYFDNANAGFAYCS